MAVPSNIISPLFAEPNLPQQYTESLGAPFGDRYVYTIFMQGINGLPDIPSSAEGSELTARVKEVNGNDYIIVEHYYTKQEGEWVADGDPKIISEWTEEEEASGGGGNVILSEDSGYLVNGTNPVTLMDLTGMVISNKVPWVMRDNIILPFFTYRTRSTGTTVTFRNRDETVTYEASTPAEPLVNGGGK